jgi:RND superfamily putative drug exporter
VLVAITLLPAMLSFAGDKVLSRRQRRADVAAVAGEDIEESETNRGFAWAHFVIRFRIPALIVGLIAIGVMTIPAASMQLALPDDGTAPKGSTARIAYDMISEGFGEGFNGRLIMVVHSDQPAATAAGAQSAMRVAGTTAGVVAVTPPNLSADRRTALLAVIPAYGPTDKRTFALVRDLRTGFVPLEQAGRADIALTGVTAVGIDVSDKLRAALPVYLLVVVGLSFALLALVFRSILVPIKATLGFLLTIGATFGVTVAVFQWGWLSSLAGLDKAGPLVSFLPILLIGILFGLAMDYEVFLVSRMREDYVHGETAREAVVSGVGHGARVVVAAGLIMISVFSGFILVHDATVKSMGFALAFGVLVDAFVVRLTLVPAVMSFLGGAAWWLPRWIDRAMPNVDIEGESLRTPVSTAAPGPQLTGTGA